MQYAGILLGCLMLIVVATGVFASDTGLTHPADTLYHRVVEFYRALNMPGVATTIFSAVEERDRQELCGANAIRRDLGASKFMVRRPLVLKPKPVHLGQWLLAEAGVILLAERSPRDLAEIYHSTRWLARTNKPTEADWLCVSYGSIVLQPVGYVDLASESRRIREVLARIPQGKAAVLAPRDDLRSAGAPQ